jgi:hypothetical protein
VKPFRLVAIVGTFLIVVLSVSVALAQSDALRYRTVATQPTAAPPLRHGIFLAPGGIRRADANGLLNSDLAIYVSDGSTFTSLAAEGHLRLKPATGKPAGTYSGQFIDDLAGGAAFKAGGTSVSDTALDGHYVINTGNGKFTFTIGTGAFTSTVPKQYGHKATIATVLYGAHAYMAQAPLSVSIGSFTIGGFMAPIAGTLTLTTDAAHYIVPDNAKRRINSSFAYTQMGKLGQTPITSYGSYSPPDGSGDGYLTLTVHVGGWTVHVVDVHEDTAGQKTFSGNALADSKSGLVSEASFSAH